MAFIDMKLGEVQEPKCVPGGQRYNLTIADAKINPPKSADKGATIEVNIGINEHPTSPNVRHFISLPRAGEKPSTTEFKKLMLKRFLVQFNIPHNDDGFEVADFAGATTNALLSETSPDDSTQGVIYNRLELDKLKG